MISDAEFEYVTGVAVADISPKLEPFSWFELDLAKVRDNGTLVNPNLKLSPLWRVKRQSGAKCVSLALEEEKASKAVLLAKYSAQGFGFEAPPQKEG